MPRDEEEGYSWDEARPHLHYDDSCTLGSAQRVAIADAMLAYLKTKGIVEEWVDFHFADKDLDEHEEGLGNIRGLGFGTSPSAAASEEYRGPLTDKDFPAAQVVRAVFEFNNNLIVSNFRTLRTDNSYTTATTWEDVVEGVNKTFELLKLDIKIDTSLFRTKS